jgi:hypothetical protein
MIILSRIIYALDPSATAHKEETKGFAGEIVNLHSAIRERGPIHGVLSVRVAHAVLFSANAWAGREPDTQCATICTISAAAWKQFNDFNVRPKDRCLRNVSGMAEVRHRFSRSGSIIIDDWSRGYNKPPRCLRLRCHLVRYVRRGSSPQQSLLFVRIRIARPK